VKRIAIVEAVRGFAATYVLAGHLFSHTAGWTVLLRFGQEAVIIFFVVSGFVVMHSTITHPDKSFRGYFARRFFRIYPIFLLALALSYALSTTWTVDIRSLIGNILMLQDVSFAKPGVLFRTFEGNLPLWSLSYEWWFYMMFFPLYRFVEARAQLPIVTAAAVGAVIAYNATHFQPLLFIAYFPLWWAGVEIARAKARGEPIPFGRILMSLALTAATFAAYLIAAMAAGGPIRLGLHPVLELRHALTGIAIVAAVIVYHRLEPWRLDRIAMPFAVVAPISYGIYALQWPILTSAAAQSLPSYARLVCEVLAVVAVAYAAEMASRHLVMRLHKRIDRPVRTSVEAI